MHKDDIKIQLITEADDIAAIAAQVQSATWDAGNEIDDGSYTTKSLTAFVNEPRTYFCIATVGGSFAGMASGSIMLHPHDSGQWLYVDELDVAVPHRRKGVGRAIMEFLEAHAKELGCYELGLGADSDNEPANKLYKSLQPDEIEPVQWYSYELDEE